jgi:hypothetical protein
MSAATAWKHMAEKDGDRRWAARETKRVCVCTFVCVCVGVRMLRATACAGLQRTNETAGNVGRDVCSARVCVSDRRGRKRLTPRRPGPGCPAASAPPSLSPAL